MRFLLVDLEDLPPSGLAAGGQFDGDAGQEPRVISKVGASNGGVVAYDPSAFNGLCIYHHYIASVLKTLTFVTPLHMLNNYMHVNSFICV